MSLRDGLAGVIESQPALMTSGNDQQDWFRAREIADAVLAWYEPLIGAVKDAFDPNDLDCGRVGMTCVSVSPANRWCRPCRIRTALDGLVGE